MGGSEDCDKTIDFSIREAIKMIGILYLNFILILNGIYQIEVWRFWVAIAQYSKIDLNR